MKNLNYKYNSLCLNEIRKNLAALGNCSLRRLRAPTFGALPSERRIATVPVGDLDQAPFHLRQAFLPGWLIRGSSSVSNPFTGKKIHRIFSFIRFTCSYGYESTGARPTLFAIFPLTFVPSIQYAG